MDIPLRGSIHSHVNIINALVELALFPLVTTAGLLEH